MLPDRLTRHNGRGVLPKESFMTDFSRYAAMVAVRHQAAPARAAFPDELPMPATVTLPRRALEPARPYATAPVQTTAHAMRRMQTGWRWAHAQLGVALALVATGVTVLLAAPSWQIMGWLAFALALAEIFLGWLAGNALRQGQVTRGGVILFTWDVLLVAATVAVIGPRLEAIAVLPGLALILALVVEPIVALLCAGLAAILFAAGSIILSVQAISPLATPPTTLWMWLDPLLAIVAMGLLLAPLGTLLRQIKSAESAEAATRYLLNVEERRAQIRRIAIDADAIALQTQLSRAMRGGTPQAVTTCEELAPLAGMVNAATARLPHLLRDREERLRLERALRELSSTLETALAGFTFAWPAPSGTLVDRLVVMLRMARAPDPA
jgi:hypothetical protein